MIKSCSTCVNNTDKRCRRGVWSAGPGVTDEALKKLRAVSADECFYWEAVNDMEQHNTCNGCKALDPAMWICELGYPVKALRKFTPAEPCPKPATDEELQRWS